MSDTQEQVDALQAIRETVQAQAPIVDDSHGSNLEDAVVTGWVAVVEWMSPDGSKWLQRLSGDAGDSSLVSWEATGLHHEAMYGDWPEAE